MGKLRLTLLGTGTSGGVPTLGCTCEVCRSSDPRDHRLRTSALLETPSTRILIDAGPDVRAQLLAHPFRKIDAVLLSHPHYDHMAGLDDLRPFCYAHSGVDVLCEPQAEQALRQMMPYCFPEHEKALYPGAPILRLGTINAFELFKLGDIDVLPIRVMHGKMPIIGFRFGPLAYITDMKEMPQESYEALQGVTHLVINALRWERPHHSHQLVGDAIEVAQRIGAGHVWLTHLTHLIGLTDEANARLPEHVRLGEDGMVIEVG